MRENGFNMYTVKGKKNYSLYQNHTFKTSEAQEKQMKAYIAHPINRDVTKNMKSIVKGIVSIVFHK